MTIKGRKQNLVISAESIKKFVSIFVMGGLWILIRSFVLQMAKRFNFGCTFTNLQVEKGVIGSEGFENSRDYMINALEKGYLEQFTSDQGKILMCHGAMDGSLRIFGKNKKIEDLPSFVNPNSKYILIACFNQARKEGYRDNFWNVEITVPEVLTRELTHTIGDFTGENEFTCVAIGWFSSIQKWFAKFR